MTLEKTEISPSASRHDPITSHGGQGPRNNPSPSSSITRLPDDAVLQIRSSATITSLNGVILGLVRNSIDAKATRICIEFNYRAGGCMVEDDGVGIPPGEFEPDGGLGRMFHTSKFEAISESLYGRSGVFLASLSSLCLLRITSRHLRHRSINSITIHHSSAISRLSPAPETHELNNRAQGTRVTVRDLFGNMPVRVKQRGLLHNDRSECDRLSRDLRYHLAALLLACRRPVCLRLRDLVLSSVHNIAAPQSSKLGDVAILEPLFSDRSWVQSLFSQSGLPTPIGSKQWIPAYASSGSVSIQGIISLEPAPTKQSQFISVGIEPLSYSEGHRNIFDYVNKIFSHSSFGGINRSEVEEEDIQRRKMDGRFKRDECAPRDLRSPAKCLDRWPMFYIRIRFKHGSILLSSASLEVLSEARLQTVFECLYALISNWLKSNNFTSTYALQNPYKSRFPQTPRRRDSEACSARARNMDDLRTTPETILSPTRTTPFSSRGGKRVSYKKGQREHQAESPSPLGRFTRIRSGRQIIVQDHTDPNDDKYEAMPLHAHIDAERDVNDRQALIRTGIGARLCSATQCQADELMNVAAINSSSDLDDSIIEWEDPYTKECHLLVARTGQRAGKDKLALHKSSLNCADSATRPSNGPASRLLQATATSPAQKHVEWLDAMLKDWRNPVFQPTERSLRQANPNLSALDQLRLSLLGRQPSELAPIEESAADSHKLNKHALDGFRVIAQVDGKFVLAVSPQVSSSASYSAPLLILIDQHAADERVNLEDLLSQLVRAPATDAPYSTALGHTAAIDYTVLARPLAFQISSHEADLLETHASYFANWAILFDVERVSFTCEAYAQPQAQVVVRTLPPVIAERSQNEPGLLISLLRSEAWALAEAGPARSWSRKAAQPVVAADGDAHAPPSTPWLRALASIPQPLLSQINSRACRSAIMFNDVLSLAECERLVTRLARCVFPFQCAHGRPSMVPLVSLNDGAFAGDRNEVDGKMGFWEGWRTWRKRVEANSIS